MQRGPLPPCQGPRGITAHGLPKPVSLQTVLPCAGIPDCFRKVSGIPFGQEKENPGAGHTPHHGRSGDSQLSLKNAADARPGAGKG